MCRAMLCRAAPDADAEGEDEQQQVDMQQLAAAIRWEQQPVTAGVQG